MKGGIRAEESPRLTLCGRSGGTNGCRAETVFESGNKPAMCFRSNNGWLD